MHGSWYYLHRAVDLAANTLDFVLSPTHEARTAEYFLRILLGAAHTMAQRVIDVAGNAAYPAAFKTLQEVGEMEPEYELRPVKNLNNIVEQDHRFSKRRVKPGWALHGIT